MDRKASALRVSLGLAIAAMIAVFVTVWLEVRPRIQNLSKERNVFRTSSEQNRVRATKAETFARDLVARLADAEAQRAAALQTSQVVTDRNARLLMELEEARAKLHTARQELARWNATGAAADEVASLARDKKALGAQLTELQAKNDRLSRALANANRTLDSIPDVVPELPPVHGAVLVVDPKWDFVVLNLGETNGLLKNGVLMISREGKLIGKVKVRHIGPDRSIADILPAWRVAEVREGDEVMN